MNVGRHRLLAVGPLTGTWYRAVRQHHFPTALAHAHTASAATRFNVGTAGRPGFPVLYFAEDQQLCLLEVAAMLGFPLAGQPLVANPQAGPWTVFPVQVVLSRVVDLCDPAQIQVVGTSVQELTGDWRGYVRGGRGMHLPTAPTQQLGATLFARARIEGLITYSTKDSTRRNLVVFPTRLRPGSRVDLLDPITGQGQRLGPAGTLSPLP